MQQRHLRSPVSFYEFGICRVCLRQYQVILGIADAALHHPRLVDLIVQVHFFYDGFHQTFGIRRIVNRKIGSKTQRLSLGPQYP